MKQPAPPKSNHYVSNIEFYAAMRDYKQACRDAAEQGLPKPQNPNTMNIYYILISQQYGKQIK